MRIHPTAVVSPETEFASGVVVEPYAVFEGPVRVGRGCTIGSHARLIGPLTLGEGNQVYSNAVLGERPQHFQYKDEPTSVTIGNNNVFREHVTVHRGTGTNGATTIGDGNHFMAGSHVGHDCHVGNNCTASNNALLGGHCIVEDNVSLGGNSAVHQNCRMGRLSMLSAVSITTKDVPPFVVQNKVNSVIGINTEGLRRAEMMSEDIMALHRAFSTLFLDGLTLPLALAQLEKESSPAVQELVRFIRGSRRGINLVRQARPNLAA